jgi:monoamine oxidase
VTAARNGSGGVEVALADGSTIRADFGICAFPPHLAAALDSNWDREVVDALGEPEPVTTAKIGLEYDRRFWETDDRIFGGITHADPSVRDIWYPSTGYFGDGGVLVGAYPFGTHADRFSRLPPAGREELAVSVGEEIHGPVYRDELRSSFSVDWATEETRAPPGRDGAGSDRATTGSSAVTAAGGSPGTGSPGRPAGSTVRSSRRGGR